MIGKKIKQLRMEKGITLSTLADRSSVSKSYLSYIERGLQKNPSIQVLEKIADVLNVDVNYLLHDQADEKLEPDIENEWVELIHSVAKYEMTKKDLQELKEYIAFLKWRNQEGD